MTIPQKEQIDPEIPGYYHLISRCVWRTFLCSLDPDTEINYKHHRRWNEKQKMVYLLNKIKQIVDAVETSKSKKY